MKNTLIYKHKTSFGTVFLKSRKNGLNPESLYLEIYLKATRKRQLQFLGMYYTGNPLSDSKIKQDAIGRCINYECAEKKALEMTFSYFCLEQTAKIDKEQSRINPKYAIKKLHQFAKTDNITFSQINERFLLSFREWLLKKAVRNWDKINLGQNTADLYLSIIMRFANRAQRKGYIPLTAYNHVDIPAISKVIKVPITFTEEEIIKLQGTPYEKQEICKALMLQFACGQRWGDIKNMTWEQIIFEGGQYKVVLKQEKTDKILPSFISTELMNWVGEQKERKGKIFTSIPLHDHTIRVHLQKWCKEAGINKKVGVCSLTKVNFWDKNKLDTFFSSLQS